MIANNQQLYQRYDIGSFIGPTVGIGRGIAREIWV